MHTLVMVALLLIVVIVHEVSHAYAALMLGDTTARDAGRLTLNPAKHIDPVGTVLVPAILVISPSPIVFGWARPVPIDPRNFDNIRKGVFLTSLAGPLSNFLLALVFSAFFWLDQNYLQVEYVAFFAFFGIITSIVLGLFNLLPIPPLDGSGLVSALLPPKAAREYEKLGRYGLLIIVGLLYFGLLNRFLLPAANILTRMLTGWSFI